MAYDYNVAQTPVNQHLPPEDRTPPPPKVDPKDQPAVSPDKVTTIKDPVSGKDITVVEHTVQQGECVWTLVHENGTPMSMEEFYALNGGFNSKKQDGKLEMPNPGDDPDFIVPGQKIYLKVDDAQANTTNAVNRAEGSDLTVQGLSGVPAPPMGARPDGKTPLQEAKEIAAQNWNEAQGAMEYELRLAYQTGGQAELDRRYNAMTNYSPGNSEYKKRLDASYKTVSGETPQQRDTNINGYEVHSTGQVQDQVGQDPGSVPGVSPELAESEMTKETGEFKTALMTEMNAEYAKLSDEDKKKPDAYKKIGDKVAERFADPKVQAQVHVTALQAELAAKPNASAEEKQAIVDAHLKGATAETWNAAYKDPGVKAVIDKSVQAAYDKGGADAAAARLREIAQQASPDALVQVVAANKDLVGKIFKGLSGLDSKERNQTVQDLVVTFNLVNSGQGGPALVKELAKTVGSLDRENYNALHDTLLYLKKSQPDLDAHMFVKALSDAFKAEGRPDFAAGILKAA